MVISKIRFIILMLIIFAGIMGCSGGSPDSVISPAIKGDNTITKDSVSAPLDGLANGILGVFRFAIDLKNLKAEITPARNLSAIGDVAMPDITQYFISTPCRDCFGIENIGLSDENELLITFKMKHPYPADSPRKDLDVFDVRGIMILPGADEYTSLPYIDIDGDGFADEAPKGNFNTLINADGYTYHYDDVAMTLFGLDIAGNLNPYRLFFTENNPDPSVEGSPIPWHKMAQGSPYDKKIYHLKYPDGGGTLSFVFVIECAYGQSALFGIPPGEPGSRSNPMYFNPEFNRKEAYRVTINPYADLIAGDTNSHSLITAKVEDWQNSQPAGWDLQDPSSIRYRSNVGSASLSVPAISNVLLTKTTPDSGNGTRQNPYIFTFDVYNNQAAAAGEYTGLLTVMDQYEEDGRVIQGSTPAIKFANFTNYQAIGFKALEPGANRAPVAIGDADPNPVNHNETVNFIDDDSYDPDTGDSITLYEWDYNYDGTIFTVDSSSSQPNQASTSYQNTTGSDIQVTARLRVTDTHSATDEENVVITVHTQNVNNVLPIAIANANPNPVTSGRTVQFIDILSDPMDPAGDYIALYEWDPNIYDGINYEYQSDQPNMSSHVYMNTGLDPIQFSARLRVTDSYGGQDTDDVTITVNPNQLPEAVCSAEPNPTRGGIQVHFIDRDSYDNDPTGWIIKYEWDFDYDGVTFDIDNTSPNADQAYHTYENTGPGNKIFTAALRVTDNALTTDICTVDVTVEPNNPPVAAGYAVPNPVRALENTTLHAEGSSDPDPGDSITKIEWDFDYDGSFTADWSSNVLTDTIPTTYENPTLDPIEKTAMLRVYDESNIYGDVEVIITVDPPLVPPVITHLENKTVNNTGKWFTYKACNVNSTQIAWSGLSSWDFTLFGSSNTYTEEFISADSAEFAGYRPDYPAATTVFKTPGDLGTNYAPRYYDNTGNGYQCELGQESSFLGPGYGYKFDQPVKIPFPMELGYTEYKVASGLIADLLSFTMTFEIDAVGYGEVTTELGTYVCLLMRTYTVVSLQGEPDEEFVTYEWLADDGTKIATGTTQNFDPATYIPIGSIKCARLTSHN